MDCGGVGLSLAAIDSSWQENTKSAPSQGSVFPAHFPVVLLTYFHFPSTAESPAMVIIIRVVRIAGEGLAEKRPATMTKQYSAHSSQCSVSVHSF